MVHSLSTSLVVLLLFFSYILSANGFVVPFISERRRASTSLRLSDTSSSEIRANRNKPEQERTLYDVIMAKPSDSQEVLKARYYALVRRLHPDARVGEEEKAVQIYTDLSDINAAWQVLSDPKQRLEYDRSLKVKAISDGIENLVSEGIKNAIPFFQKTADTTVAAVETSTKAVNKGTAEAKKALSILDLNESSRQLEQRAAIESKRAQKLKQEMANLSQTKSIPNLQNPNAEVSAIEATRILKSFDSVPVPSMLQNDIATLGDVELQLKDSNRNVLNTSKAAKLTERKVEQARKAEEFAQKKLEEAQRALEKAQQNYLMAQDANYEANQESNLAGRQTEQLELSVSKLSNKVRLGLVKMQDKYLSQEAKNMKLESKRLQDSVNALMAQAEQMQNEANKLDQ